MDPEAFRNLREGQAAERDQLLESLLVERGLFTREEALRLRQACAPGDLGEALVRQGRLSSPQLEQFERESELREILDAAAEDAAPPEVRDVLADATVRVGKYVLVRLLGRGGMGEVWKAWDMQLSRWVALKFLHGDQPAEVRRFLREAMLAAKLSHPGIARVYEVGALSPRPYIAMQYVAGTSLANFPRGNRRVLAGLIRDAAVAVHAAHEGGVIHRDLKPANLMVERSYAGLRAYVMDFGLAKQAETDSSLSKPGAVLGTPAYMPPEQALGRLTEIGVRSDVYALGATLYHLLAGRPPFVGKNTYDIVRKLLEEEPRSLRSFDPAVESDLETIVMKCLEKEPARRYRSARALAEDLTRFLQGEAIEAHPPSAIYQVGKFVTRRKSWMLGAAGVGLALLVALAALPRWFQESSARRKKEQELARQHAREEAVERARPHLDAGRKSLAQLDRLLTQADWKEEEAERLANDARKSLERALEEDPKSPEAHLEMARSYLMEDRSEPALEHCGGAIEFGPAFAAAYLERAILGLERVLRERMGSWGKLRAETPEQARLRTTVEQDLREVRRWSTESGELVLAEGLMLFAEERFREAAARLEEYVRIGLSDARGWLWVGLAWAQGGTRDDLEKSVRGLDTLLRYRPKHTYGLYLRGAAHARLAQWEPALADLDRVIRLRPNSPLAYLGRGTVWYERGDLDRAIADYGVAARLSPGSYDAHYGLGLAYLARIGRYGLDEADRAILHLTTAYELQPRSDGALGNRGTAHARKGDWLFAQGRTHEAHAERLRAIGDYSEALALKPDPDVYVNRAKVHRDRGDDDRAMADYAAALSLDPRMVWAYVNRGRLRNFRGDLDGAIFDYSSALELDPRLYDVRFSRGDLYRRKAEREAAVRDLEKGLEDAPQDWVHRAAAEALLKELRAATKETGLPQ